MTIRAVTFDLDGTLYKKGPVKRRFFFRHFAALKHVRVAQAVREAMRGEVFASGTDFFRAEQNEVARRLELDVDGAREVLHDVYEVRLLDVLRAVGPQKDAKAALSRLREAGVRCAVVSDFAVEDKLAALGLADVGFDALVAADATGALKPYPGCFEAALELLQVAPEDAVHVGDRADTDKKGAESAGMRALVLGQDVPSLAAAADRVLAWRAQGGAG